MKRTTVNKSMIKRWLLMIECKDRVFYLLEEINKTKVSTLQYGELSKERWQLQKKQQTCLSEYEDIYERLEILESDVVLPLHGAYMTESEIESILETFGNSQWLSVS